MQLLSFCQRITYLKDAASIRQTYDISCPCLIDSTLSLSHKLCGRSESHRLSLTHMQIWLVTTELTAAHLTEGYTGTVVGVDICCYLEDKTSKFLLFRLHITFLSLSRTRTWGYLVTNQE